jgi:hypothetical protein
MPGWLDDLLGKTVQANTVAVPDRKRLNFVGAGVSVNDNPANLSTDVTISVVASPGKDPLNPKSNSGTPVYPSSAAFVIAAGVTFVRGGLADGDSIRFFGAGGGETTQVAYQFGRVTNLTAFVIDLYPLLSQHIFLNGFDQGAGNPVEITPGSTVVWAFDLALNAHVSV